MDGQPPPQRQEQPPPPNFAAASPQPASPQVTQAGQPRAYQQVASMAAPGLPQQVIDTGNHLRANGIEITPRTVYLANVLGPQGAVDLIKRTGSTSSDAVPSPDAATGRQILAWTRQLRLGPAAAGLPAVPAFDPSNPPVPAAPPVWGNAGMPAQQDDMSEGTDMPTSDPSQPFA
jgi:hypothetical protein